MEGQKKDHIKYRKSTLFHYIYKEKEETDQNTIF